MPHRAGPRPDLKGSGRSRELGHEVDDSSGWCLDLVGHWAAAEQQKDAGLLDGLLAEDFAGVGPLGFVLTREQWPVRFANGLVNRSFAIEDPQVRGYGAAAVVVGVLAQETSWQGGDNSGRFRVTL